MSIRGNSGFIDTDKRFGTTSGDTKGVVAREQHFLERTQGRFAPIGPLSPPDPTVWYDAADVELRSGTSNVLTWFDQSGNGITASGNGSLNNHYIMLQIQHLVVILRYNLIIRIS